MRAELFYNYHLIGDVLMIIIDNEKVATRLETKDDVTFICDKEELIGINIFDFSKTVKIKEKGHIVLPADALIDIINNKLALVSDIQIDYIKESGFKIGKILSVEEHPLSDHLHLLKVDIGQEVLDIVCGAYNVKPDMKVVVATIGTTMLDGSVIKEGMLLKEKSFGMCCSPKELGLDIEYPLHHLFVIEDDKELGSDFFELKGGH